MDNPNIIFYWKAVYDGAVSCSCIYENADLQKVYVCFMKYTATVAMLETIIYVEQERIELI